MNWLNAASDIASILTAVVAIGAYGWYQLSIYLGRRRLEEFLKHQKGKRSKNDTGRRSILFLASQLRMTESDVMEAGFRSRIIKPVPGFDKETGQADEILFEYDQEKSN
jgi:hypothetical protein